MNDPEAIGRIVRAVMLVLEDVQRGLTSAQRALQILEPVATAYPDTGQSDVAEAEGDAGAGA